MKRLLTRVLLILVVAVSAVSVEAIASTGVFAGTSNESGTAVVILTDGTVKDYGTDIRGAWHYCDTHKGCTMKLTSDIKLNSNFSTGGKTYDTDITFDLNGFTIDCQNRTNAFNLFKRGGLKLIDSSSAKTGKIINGKATYGGAIKTMGSLEMDGITIENCSATEPLTGGGAIYAWVIDVWIFKVNEPHIYVNNCTINNCKADCGGAIEVHTDNLVPSAINQSNAFSNSGINALKEVKAQEEGSNFVSGASILISNSTIKNCKSYSKGGAMNIVGEATLDNCTISNCTAQYGGGGINVDEAGTLKMFNSTITGCSVDDGNGGGIYIQYGLGGESYTEPGHAEIFGGSITNNTAKDGSGIYFPDGHGGSSLKIGGELIVKDNLDKSGRPDNIEIEEITIRLFDEGLYGNADVGVGTNEKGSERVVSRATSNYIAERTAKHMKADHLKGTYNDPAPADEKIGIYSKPNEDKVYIGPSRKMELINFELTDHPEIKAEINRETQEITVRYPFNEGIGEEGAWPEPILVTWASGVGGTIRTNHGSMGVPDKPFKNSVTTFKKDSTAEDEIVMECGGGISSWSVHFVNEGETRCRIRVVNGSITNHIPYAESGDTKDYKIVTGTEVELVADDPYSSQCFDFWGFTNRGIVPAYEFNDRYSAKTKIVVPASSGDRNGLVFTACYTDTASVKVINGTHTDGSTEKYFEPGKHVKVTADKDLKNFDHWEVVSGKLTLSTTQAKSRVLEFNMGLTDYDDPESGNYGDIVVKAVALYVDKPVATPASGKYTGNQNVELSCPTENSVIYYSLNGSDYTQYTGSPIKLTVATEELQREYTLNCYSVLVDAEGKALVQSDTVTENYTIMNPSPKTICQLKLINGKTKDGKTEDLVKPGTELTVKADNAPTGKYFKKWKVVSGKLSLTDEQLASKELSFIMPNCDITLEAEYDGSQILPFNAKAINGTINGLKDSCYFEGSVVTAAASPAGGKVFDHWIATGLSLSAQDEKSPVFTFAMPGNDVQLEAVFVDTPINPHTLSVVNGYLENDTEKTSGSYRPDVRVSVNGQATTNSTTYKFNHWEVISCPIGFELTEVQKKTEKIIIEMPNGDVSLKAVYDATQSPDTAYVVHGKIGDGTETSKEFNEGETVKMSADVAGGMVFDHWDAYGIKLTSEQKYQASDMTFKMPNNAVVLVARYESAPTTPYVLLTVNGCNYDKDGTPGTSNRGTYAKDTTVVVKAVKPSETGEYKFVKWVIVAAPEGFELTEDQKKTENIEITMPDGDVVLKAVFAKKYSVAAIHGTVNDQESSLIYDGDTINAESYTAGGLVFDHWDSYGLKLSESQKYSSSFTSTMPADDVILEAVYGTAKIEPHKLSLEHGRIITDLASSKGESEGSYYAGSKVLIKADFAANLVFDYWETDGITLSEEDCHQAMLTITMPDNEVSLRAIYKTADISPHVLTVVNGNIAAPKDITKISDNSAIFYQGCKITVEAAPKSGYVFDHWDAEGIPLTVSELKSSSLTITMPGNDAKLTAVYKSNGTDTGDDSNLLLYVGLAVVAMVALATVVLYKKRN